jgi:PKD repeat protein
LSGPAPLAVMFDATATTVDSGSAFHQLSYEFNFGDDRGQTWPFSGVSKNVQRGGPLAAHVFEVPGTYTVRLRANSAIASSESTVTITVQDPNSVYAGAKTVCVSASSNFEGCPSGASQQTSLPSSLDDSRVLLRRGESFGTLTLRHADNAVQVGAFGSGSTKPRIQTASIGVGRPTTSEWPEDITLMDLDVANGILQEGSASRLLFLRLTLDDAGANNRLHLSRAVSYWVNDDTRRLVSQDQFKVPSEIFVVDNRIIGNTSSADNPLHNLTMSGARMAVMGNELSQVWEHNIRMYTAHKVFVGHNAVRGRSSDGGRHALKIHSAGTDPYSDTLIYALRRASSQIVVANNLFGDAADNNNWTVAIRPQSESYGEGIEDVIVEANTFIKGTRTTADILMVGRRFTTRANTRIDGSAPSIQPHSGSYPLSSSWLGPYWNR